MVEPTAISVMVNNTHKKSKTTSPKETPASSSDKTPASSDKTPASSSDKKKKASSKKMSEMTPWLGAFNYEYKDRLICGMEMDNGRSSNTDRGPFMVAQFIEFGTVAKNNYRKLDLTTLTYDLIRKVAANFGCRGLSSGSMFECRKKMAIRKSSGTVYDNLELPNPHADATEKRVNTHFRTLNACFLPEMIERFVKLNDLKGRSDFEAASGGSPVKSFWIDVSELVNDAENNTELGIVLESKPEENERLHELVKEGKLNLSDFNQVTHQTCAQIVKDAMKAREAGRLAMKVSGEHTNDFFDFCRRPHTKVRKNTVVDPLVCYYADVLCSTHPAVDGAMAVLLKTNLKSNSEETPGNNDDTMTAATSDITAASGSIASPSQNSMKIESLLKTIEQLRGVNLQKEKLIEVQTKQAEQELQSKQWAEYECLGQKVLDHLSKNTDRRLVRVLALRVRMLENELGVPGTDSIVPDLV